MVGNVEFYAIAQDHPSSAVKGVMAAWGVVGVIVYSDLINDVSEYGQKHFRKYQYTSTKWAITENKAELTLIYSRLARWSKTG